MNRYLRKTRRKHAQTELVELVFNPKTTRELEEISLKERIENTDTVGWPTQQTLDLTNTAGGVK